jgi:putative glutamine amidotransferase
MPRPIIGIPACSKRVDGYDQHATPARYGGALIAAANAIPLLLPPEGEAMLEVLDRLDGLLLSGSPSNVAPGRYGEAHDATPDDHDLARDATTLPLLNAALARGMPILCICRGLQELNVALGGTLFQQVHELAGRDDHRGGDGTREHRFRIKHQVTLTGSLALIIGATTIEVNSLHGQAIDRLAPGLTVEATAPDGTIEAVRVTQARNFAIAVQWHPEWQPLQFPDRQRLFAAFGAACSAYAQGAREAA